MQTIQTTDRRQVADQAIGVLHATCDGERLAPSDLSLLQFVVNRGRDALSAPAVARWDYIVSATSQGNYEPPWLHGVQHLLRLHDGSVLWRDVAVEHYTHSDMQAQRRDAQELGACCRLIEQRGQVVTAQAVFNVWRELDVGAGLDLPRWAVMWSAGQPEQGLSLHRLGGESAPEIERSRQAAYEAELSHRQCGSSALRCMTVLTREDLAAVREAVVDDCRWYLRAYPGCNRPLTKERYDLMHAHLVARIDETHLPSRDQVRSQILAPVMPPLAHELNEAHERSAHQERDRG